MEHDLLGDKGIPDDVYYGVQMFAAVMWSIASELSPL